MGSRWTLYRHVETHCSEPEDKVAELKHLRRLLRENGYSRNFVNQCRRKRDERQKCTESKYWRGIPYVNNVSETVSNLLAPPGVGVAYRPEATTRRQIIKPKDPLPRQETSGVVYRIWCSCGQIKTWQSKPLNYSYEAGHIGRTSRCLFKSIGENLPAWLRKDDVKTINSALFAYIVDPKESFRVILNVLPNYPNSASASNSRSHRHQVEEAGHVRTKEPPASFTPNRANDGLITCTPRRLLCSPSLRERLHQILTAA
ncbi:unnamed protein product [Schistocephalus solidus]|uniref:FLYWCH-type domain-containing protein n=1 Tax=Schistocephalus solidus TaxID=70667 RepID=A0A183STQ0_SCHSO|nr:unnamed protein product [Schistocephalus solidus]